MTNHTARMAALLGELRREMNGAVAESMQRGEGGYGLNYGVTETGSAIVSAAIRSSRTSCR